MLAKLKTWPLRSCVFELVSHAAARYAFSFVPDLQKGLVLSHVSCHSRSPTRSVLEQNYDPCSLSSSYLCRMQTYCHPFRQKKTTRVRCLIWQPSQTQPRQYVRRLLSASFCSASVHSPHVWRPYYLMSEVSTEQYAVVVLLSMSNGVLYQVRTLHPIGNIVLYQVPRVNQPFN